MTQLDELYGFVSSLLPERLMKTTGADAWMEDIEIIHAAKAWGLGQRRVAIRQYQATLAWERWPYRQYDPDTLFALVMVWLAKHANEHYNRDEMPPPDVIMQLKDNDNAILYVTVPLADNIILIEDEDEGIIPIEGKRYRVAPPTVNTATAGWIVGANGATTPTHPTGESDAS
ncbi:TPA: phage tail protein [Yersinia enterocolitica]|uniref:phage tail protein n=1 Tax=Yersinia enterocolitica TaxID=630 RepID=UPI0028B8F728|nr:phage tail protein [Yersinia enterocolitica]EKN3832676.1 phage tail protein [Yersinia enterocolitica]EKN4881228.1 phage tail protein [Yersinia enterocolitica]EKN6090361.1 phage tail protein [Yersinia enterocolitica]ELI7915178.1 phage tail protein [Yersinia enterocolitica]